MIILAIISFLLFVLAPDYYSWSYCTLILCVFILEFITIYRKESKIEIFNFHVFYSISFLFVNIIFPVFVYPVDAEFSLFRYSYNVNIITKCTALSLLAYSCYSIAYIKVRKYKVIDCIKPVINITPKGVKYVFIYSIILLMLFLGFDGLSYYSDAYSGTRESYNSFIKYIIILFGPFHILLCILSCYVKSSFRKYILIYLSFVILLLLFSGTRALSLSLGLILAYDYSKKYRISPIKAILIVVLGVFVLSLIGNIRGDEVKELTLLGTKDKIWYEYALDLIVNNRNLYVLYDYAVINDYTYGQSMLASLLQPIPFLQSFISNIFEIPTYLMKSSNVTTYLEFGSNSMFGLGTNQVGDVFLAFGTLGVIAFFLFLGWFVANVRNRINYSIVFNIIYLIILSDAVFMCRASFFNSFAIIIWSVLLVKIFKIKLV